MISVSSLNSCGQQSNRYNNDGALQILRAVSDGEMLEESWATALGPSVPGNVYLEDNGYGCGRSQGSSGEPEEGGGWYHWDLGWQRKPNACKNSLSSIPVDGTLLWASVPRLPCSHPRRDLSLSFPCS